MELKWLTTPGIFSDLAGVFFAFLLWTFMIYWLHRWAHISHRLNPLWQIHRAHHAIIYLGKQPTVLRPRWYQYFFWLGDWRASIDVIISMTLPAILIACIWPRYGIPLLVFHYFYEVFFSEYVLDHNPRIQGKITQIFAWGDFHLFHHMAPRKNFCLIITLWDRVFGTAEDPHPGTALRRQQVLTKQLLARTKERA